MYKNINRGCIYRWLQVSQAVKPSVLALEF